MSEPRKYTVTVTRNLVWTDPRAKHDMNVIAYDAQDALFQARESLKGEPAEWFTSVDNVRPFLLNSEGL